MQVQAHQSQAPSLAVGLAAIVGYEAAELGVLWLHKAHDPIHAQARLQLLLHVVSNTELLRTSKTCANIYSCYKQDVVRTSKACVMWDVHKQDMCGHHSSVYHMRKQGNKCTYSVLLPKCHGISSALGGRQLTCLRPVLAHLPRDERAVGRDLWDRVRRGLSEVHACMHEADNMQPNHHKASISKEARYSKTGCGYHRDLD